MTNSILYILDKAVYIFCNNFQCYKVHVCVNIICSRKCIVDKCFKKNNRKKKMKKNIFKKLKKKLFKK